MSNYSQKEQENSWSQKAQNNEKIKLLYGKWKHKLEASSCGTGAEVRMVTQHEFKLRSMLTFLTRTISIFVLSWEECWSIRGKTQLLYDKVLFQLNLVKLAMH